MHSKTDMVQSSAEALRYPYENHPGHDQVVEVRPGVLWVRLKLPFRLNHVNIYLLADGDGWTMVDAGFGNEETIAAWTALFEGPLSHVKVTRLIVTHSHPDHVGLAGWIVDRFNCPLQMSQVEYLQSVYHQNRGTEERKNAQRLFFRRHGMDENLTDKLLGRGQDYLKRVSTLPPSYHRISHGDEVSSNIVGVSSASAEAGAAAGEVLSASAALRREADVLRSEIDAFLSNIRAA